MGRTSAARAGRGPLMLLVLLLTAACAPTVGGSGGGSGNLITREMIGDPGNQNAYTIVQRLRPRWLSPRTQATITNPDPVFPEVYLDNLRFGPIDALHRIDATQINRIEYLSGLDATTRFGTGHEGGAIIVRTINSPR